MKTSVISAFLQATNPEKAPAAIPDGQFAELITEFLPEGLMLPEPLVRTFNWIEAQGWYEVKGDGENPDDYALHVYSPADRSADRDLSWVLFGPETFSLTKNWDTPLPDVDARIAAIASTSPDGGRAGIWLDENDKQWFVHIGHDTVGVISDDPLVFLQFLAIGYIEPGALESAEWTAPQEALDYHGFETAAEYDLEGDDTKPPLLPTQMRKFLESEFSLTIPNSASALGISTFTPYGDPNATDPFAKWLNALKPAPSAAEIIEEQKTIDHFGEHNDQDEAKIVIDIATPEAPRGFVGKIKSLFGSKA